jgi:pyruvate/2-oxoglutarate dehydrogenase complex dihydrolipoamide dehydrogenase (E3) component
MPTPEQYDAISIGSGEAGKFIVWHLASQGQRAITVEATALGGACPNVACLPSKNVIHSAKVADLFSRGDQFGIVHGEWHVDMAIVRERKREMVEGLLQTHLNNFTKSKAEFVMGFGTLLDANTVEVALGEGDTRVLTAPRIFITTGSRATIEPIPGLIESAPHTHVEALELAEVPDHLLILGGGFIGLELAQAMRRFGSRVTIIERSTTLLPREDPDVSEAIHQLLEDDGIDVLTSCTVTSVNGTSGSAVSLHIKQPTGDSVLHGTHLLVATGRTPNTQNMGLEAAGVKTTPSGHIQVNDRLETTTPGIWAMGDCAGSPHFTHISFDDFRIVRDNLAGGNRSTRNRQVPSCTFLDPELAHVGLSETEAKRQSIPYRLAKIPMVAVLRTRTLSETRGFLKALIGSDDRILGFTGFGTATGELLPAVQLAMANNLPYTAVQSLIITHPTVSEGLVGLFSAVPAK